MSNKTFSVMGRQVNKGDTIYVKSEVPVSIGQMMMNGITTVIEIAYAEKKWWQFWKPKKQLGYILKVI